MWIYCYFRAKCIFYITQFVTDQALSMLRLNFILLYLIVCFFVYQCIELHYLLFWDFLFNFGYILLLNIIFLDLFFKLFHFLFPLCFRRYQVVSLQTSLVYIVQTCFVRLVQVLNVFQDIFPLEFAQIANRKGRGQGGIYLFLVAIFWFYLAQFILMVKFGQRILKCVSVLQDFVLG